MLTKVFFDADVIIAGSASQKGAAFVLLQLGEFGLIKSVTSQTVIDECQRNLSKKLPDALPVFNKIIQNTLHILPDVDVKKDFHEMAHPKDLPILAAAIESKSSYLTTFNTKHFYPSHSLSIQIITPGDLLQIIRSKLNRLSS